MRKKLSLSSLETKLDRVFSEYIRFKDADEGGTASCVTCGKLAYWREMDCGHYIKRSNRGTRWEPTNCGPQCTRCNRFMDGNMDEFADYICRNYGETERQRLMTLKRQAVKFTRSDLEEMILFYKAKLSTLNREAA
jgi:hypothetical protein